MSETEKTHLKRLAPRAGGAKKTLNAIIIDN
jgi:hypothetical protein